jgi:cysteinyl-tRNA synthetase
MTEVLGVNPLDSRWNAASEHGSDDVMSALSALVEDRTAAREAARAARDFGSADQIRDQLAAAGIIVEDTPSGTRWSLARHTEA